MGGQQDIYPVANFLSAAVGNLADILPDRWAPKKGLVAFHVSVSLRAAAKFGMTISDGTITTPLQYFKDGAIIGANKLQTFTIGARSDYTYNFQGETADFSPVLINYLTIEEIYGGDT